MQDDMGKYEHEADKNLRQKVAQDMCSGNKPIRLTELLCRANVLLFAQLQNFRPQDACQRRPVRWSGIDTLVARMPPMRKRPKKPSPKAQADWLTLTDKEI